MLIYNEKTSVSPTTTHVPLNKVLKNLNSQKIVNQIKTIDAFYKKYLKIKPRIGVCGINPHCETNSKISEEKKIILPAFQKLKYSNIFVKGPFPADTIFAKNNRDKFNVIIGMYHDQVLSRIKAFNNFNKDAPENCTVPSVMAFISRPQGMVVRKSIQNQPKPHSPKGPSPNK